MANYKQLTKSERQEIYILKEKGYNQSDIAKAIGKNKSTISRELSRNSVTEKNTNKRVYLPDKAEHKKYTRRKYSKYYAKKIIANSDLRKYIDEKLQLYWSPEQIAGRWNTENEKLKVSHVIIYNYIYSAQGQKYHEYLYKKRYKPKKRRINKTKRTMIPNRTLIDERPDRINQRLEVGDFEGDLIVSKKGYKSAALTLIDRKTRLLFAEKLENRKPSHVAGKVKKIKEKVNINSITIDNGIEFKDHEEYGCATYFCHPYSSWEKGQIEYANRLIRRFIPKKSNISDYSNKQIQKIVEIINNTPRKCLGYKTPIEVYLEETCK